MRIPLFTAIGSVVCVLVLAGPSPAQYYPPYQGYQDYQSGYWSSSAQAPYAPHSLYGPPPAPDYAPYSPAPNFVPASNPPATVSPEVGGPFDESAQPSPSDRSVPGTEDVLDSTVDFDPALADCATCPTKHAQWMVSADLFLMTRVPGNSYALIKEPLPTPPPPLTYETVILDVSDFDFGYEPGWRISASRMVCDGWGVEASFFSMADGWNYDQTWTGIYELQGPGWQVGSDPNNPTDVSFRVQNRSELYSGDLNLTRGICNWATLRMGVRWIEFNDCLEIDELYTPLYSLLIATTDNHMIGPQLGADFKLFELGGCSGGGACSDGSCAPATGIRGWLAQYGGCRFRINSTINCAALYNWVKHDPYSSYIGPPLVSEANEVALLGEASLMAKFRVSDHVAVRAGYHVMALHGVAMAPDQIVTSDVVTETSSTKLGSLIAHGGTFGVEVFW